LQQPINMATTLMLDEEIRETAALNETDLDKNASAFTETLDLCLVHMKMFETDVAVNTSKSNSSYGRKITASGDCVLNTTRGRGSSIVRSKSLGNITLLTHRRDLETRLAKLKDRIRIRNVVSVQKCTSPNILPTKGMLHIDSSTTNVKKRNSSLNGTKSSLLFKCNRDTLHNTSAGGVKEVPLRTAAGNGFLQTNLSRTNGRRRNSSLNGTDSNLLFKCNRDTLHNTSVFPENDIFEVF